MADQTSKPQGHAPDNVEENGAQRQSDAPDAVALEDVSDRADGRGSDANGTPAFDEVEGAERRKLYDKGATLVSRID